MKKSLLILFFITVKIAVAQSSTSDSTNQFSPDGLKQGYWVLYGKDKNLPNYKPEDKVEEGKYMDNRKNGIWTTYWPSGKKKSEITFVNNTAKGYAKMYYEDGVLQEEGDWENQRWTGGYKMYHPNGTPFYEFNYNKSGKREGKQVYRYDNGKVMMEGDMKDGKEAGTWEERYENGDLRAKKGFNDGKLDPSKFETYAPVKPIIAKKDDPIKNAPPPPVVDITKNKKNEADKVGPTFIGDGYAKLYNLNKQISKDGTFKKYRLIEGLDYVYSKDGILIEIRKFKGGMFEGNVPIEDEKK
jgi:antitoxin component YwqK of YwqJK toxin-antitoxin module